MKTLKYILILIMSIGMFNSCLVDDESTLDLNNQGPNLAGFDLAKTSLAAIADGAEYKFDLKVKVFGPNSLDLTKDVTITVEADPSSTAKEGTHYKLNSSSVTLSPGRNMLGLFPVTMLTEGIQTPLEKSPVLVLKVTQASGDPLVINSGKPITIELNYACPSFLEGDYDVTTEYTNAAGVVKILKWSDHLTNTGIGEYRTARVGHWAPEDLGYTPGFTFTDVCGKLSVPGQNLVDTYSNWVEGTDFGSVDEETGNLYIEYSICTATGCSYYKSTYIKK